MYRFRQAGEPNFSLRFARRPVVLRLRLFAALERRRRPERGEEAERARREAGVI